MTVDHVTVFRWVQRFTPLLIDVADSLAARRLAAVLARVSPAGAAIDRC